MYQSFSRSSVGNRQNAAGDALLRPMHANTEERFLTPEQLAEQKAVNSNSLRNRLYTQQGPRIQSDPAAPSTPISVSNVWRENSPSFRSASSSYSTSSPSKTKVYFCKELVANTLAAETTNTSRIGSGTSDILL
jgi:hypothetical protein